MDVNYAGVVKARNEVFVTQNLTEKTHYISSTGIGGRHADPKVLVQMDTYAVGGIKPEQIHFLYAPTHLNPTYEYGVSFERGTYVDYGDRRQVFISEQQVLIIKARWYIRERSVNRQSGCGKM